MLEKESHFQSVFHFCPMADPHRFLVRYHFVIRLKKSDLKGPLNVWIFEIYLTVNDQVNLLNLRASCLLLEFLKLRNLFLSFKSIICKFTTDGQLYRISFPFFFWSYIITSIYYLRLVASILDSNVCFLKIIQNKTKLSFISRDCRVHEKVR